MLTNTNGSPIHYFEDDNHPKWCNDRQYTYFKRAITLAQKSTCHNQKHGCVIVRDNDIVAEGYNHTHLHMYHRFSVHAEVDALTRLAKLARNKRYMSACDMYVVRIGRDSMGHPLKFSRPCEECIKAIQKSGIRRVYYSTNTEFEHLMLEKLYSSSDASSSDSSSDITGSS